MDKALKELTQVIEKYFGADAGYLDISCLDLAKWILDSGWEKPEWISVKDRLPQEDEPESAVCGQVQVLLDNGLASTGWCNRHFKMWWHLNPGETHFIGFDYDHTPVIAWMPLAQPPKGE